MNMLQQQGSQASWLPRAYYLLVSMPPIFLLTHPAGMLVRGI
jgi:hypothetical protein